MNTVQQDRPELHKAAQDFVDAGGLGLFVQESGPESGDVTIVHHNGGAPVATAP